MKDVQKLSILTKPELVNICKRNNLSVTGEKQALAARILRKVGKIFDDEEDESGDQQSQNFWTKVLYLLVYIKLCIPNMCHEILIMILLSTVLCNVFQRMSQIYFILFTKLLDLGYSYQVINHLRLLSYRYISMFISYLYLMMAWTTEHWEYTYAGMSRTL